MVDVPVAAAESALLPSPDHPLAAALLLVVCLAIAGVLTLLSDSIDRAVVPEDDGEDDDGERESYARHLARQGSLGEAADLGAQAARVAATFLLLALVEGATELPWLQTAAAG